MADNKNFCPDCGYTQEDAQIHFDHYLCKNKNPPWSESGEPSQDDKHVKWTLGEFHHAFGTVCMVGNIGGESYRWFKDMNGTISMIPLSAL